MRVHNVMIENIYFSEFTSGSTGKALPNSEVIIIGWWGVKFHNHSHTMYIGYVIFYVIHLDGGFYDRVLYISIGYKLWFYILKKGIKYFQL